VWLRFGKNNVSVSPGTIEELLDTAKVLQGKEPATAVQILLICAVYQNETGLPLYALGTTRQALELSRHRHLPAEMVWSLWGLSALAVQQGKYEQAFAGLADLQSTLSEQNEWVLAGFIEVFRQFLLQVITHQTSVFTQGMNDQLFGDLQAFTLAWLQQWGSTAEIPGLDLQPPQPESQPVTRTAWMQFFISIRRLRGRWHDLMLAIRGEFNFQWTVHEPQSANKLSSSTSTAQTPIHLTGQDVPELTVQETHPIQELLGLPFIQETTPIPTTGSNASPAPVFNGSAQVVEQASAAIPVAVHMLGMFSMTIGEAAVKLPATRVLSLFKYMLLHHKQYIPRDVLLDMFWPDADPELARNNLNVSLHSLRRALRTVTDLPVVVFEDGAYGLASNLQLWLDVEEFEKCVRNGQQLEARNQLAAAVDEYEAAISIYRGDLLEQNPYDEWTVLDRERLRIAYLDTLDRLSQIYLDQERYAACIIVCQLIIARDRCREDAYCLLMRCYSRQGQHHLALRQYQMCVESLRTELQVNPGPETTQLYNRIRRREQV
jgi:DNA-binding SARP family transcriptional activator